MVCGTALRETVAAPVCYPHSCLGGLNALYRVLSLLLLLSVCMAASCKAAAVIIKVG